MFIAISLLLLSLFVLSFWILKESKVKLIIKLALISTFFLFCIVLGSSLQSFMGWAANGSSMPKIVAIRHVVIKEPNKQFGIEGNIYILIEHPTTRYNSWMLQMFGYKTSKSEPRLFQLPYSRSLHETLQTDVIPRLMRGQIVIGKLSKGKGGNKGGEGDGEGEDEDGPPGRGKRHGKGGKSGKGYGGESLETEYQFHILPPGYFQQKSEQE